MSVLIGKSVILSRIVQCVSFFSPLTLALYTILASIIILYQKKRARLVKLIEKIPGPPSLPILGNTIEINVDHDGKFGIDKECRATSKRLFKISFYLFTTTVEKLRRNCESLFQIRLLNQHLVSCSSNRPTQNAVLIVGHSQ